MLAGGHLKSNSSTSSQAKDSLPDVRRDLRDVSNDNVDTCFNMVKVVPHITVSVKMLSRSSSAIKLFRVQVFLFTCQAEC